MGLFASPKDVGVVHRKDGRIVGDEADRWLNEHDPERRH